MDRWVGKVAVITGHATGIGEVCAIDLIKAGMIVVGLDIQTELFDALSKKIPENIRSNLYSIKCDVRNEREIVETFKWIDEKLDGVDVLINNAAIMCQKHLVDADNSVAMHDMVNTNLLGVVWCTREAFQSMKRRNFDGHVILMNSYGGHRVPHVQGVKSNTLNLYPPTKFAMTAMIDVLRQELFALGTKIKTTSISPGPVRTGIFLNQNDDFLKNYPMLRREDISQAVLYVLSTPADVQVQELILQVMGAQF